MNLKRTIRTALPYVAIPLVSLLVFGAASRYQGAKLCKQVRIVLAEQEDNLFLDVEQVKDVLHVESYILGVPMDQLRLTELENEMINTGFVQHANAAAAANGVLDLRLKLRRPIARVKPNRGKEFYIDTEGRKMPLSRMFTARVPLLHGPFVEWASQADTIQDSTLRSIVPVLQFVHRSAFWQAQVSELVADGSGQLTMYPQLGDTKVLLGTATEGELKLKRLMAFYKKVMNVKGWNQYRSVDLRFGNQIVASNKDIVSN